MSIAPALTTDGWLARDEAALAGVLPRYTDVVAGRGEGSWLTDVDGRRFLDFSSGIGVTSTGHCHPRVVAAIREQAGTLIHTSVVTHHTKATELAERLGALCPFLTDPQVFFCNSGAEAVDGALKLARQATDRAGVVAFRHAFHGRTLAATSVSTAKRRHRDGYQPLLPGVCVAPYGTGLDQLDAMLEAEAVDAGAMIVEPVLGEGGYRVPPVRWLAGLRQRCDRHGILLIFDEVQCGIGRTGKPFAAETFGVAPDVVLFAKGVASGLPLGGIIAGRELMRRWPTGAHGSTFGGNPVACAAALATLDVLQEENCYRRARLLGRRMLARLRAVPSDAVVAVRGIGLMVGVELVDQHCAEEVRSYCLAAGLIVLTCGPRDNIVRLIPPLTLTGVELEQGLEVVEGALLDASRTSA